MALKINFSSVMTHVFSFLGATFIVCFVFYWMFYFLGTPFTLKEKEYLKKVELERELIKKIDISVRETGYLKKKIGNEMIYIPALIVNISNSTENEFENLFLIVEFSTQNKILCRGYSIFKRFKPGEHRKILLKCMDFIVLGTFVQGMTLSQTMREIQYEVLLRTGETFTENEPLKGILEFKTFTSNSFLRF